MGYKAGALAYLVLAMSLVQAAAAADAGRKVYRWVDSNGRVHYGDTLPSNAGVTGSDQLGKSGDVIQRTESLAEKKARLAREAEQAQAEKKAQEQKRQDMALLGTYTSEQEIDLARDRALEFHKLAIRSAQIRIGQIQGNLKDLNVRIKQITEEGKTAPEFLQQQFNASLTEMDGLNRTILEHQQALITVRDKYDADKARYRQLTGR